MTAQTPSHRTLFDALTDDGHNVTEWADDPSMLRAYADAIGFVVPASPVFHPGDLAYLTGTDLLVTVMEVPGDTVDGSTLVSENEDTRDAYHVPTVELVAEEDPCEAALRCSDHAGWSRP